MNTNLRNNLVRDPRTQTNAGKSKAIIARTINAYQKTENIKCGQSSWRSDKSGSYTEEKKQTRVEPRTHSSEQRPVQKGHVLFLNRCSIHHCVTGEAAG